MRLLSGLSILTCSTLFFACQKSIDGAEGNETANRNLRQFSSTGGLSYGETVFYLSNNSRENIIAPKSAGSMPGKYVSIPAGLALDAKTGVFDISKSDPGQAYKIFFVDPSGKLKDSVRIVISGVDYEDGFYKINKGESRISAKYTAQNNSEVQNTILNTFTSGENSCKGGKRLAINSRTGILDMDGTIRSNALEVSKKDKLTPNTFEISYQLPDRSRRVRNKLTVEVYQFEKESDISPKLRQRIAEREEILKRVNAMPVGNSSTTIGREATESGLESFSKPVRPPLIVIIS